MGLPLTKVSTFSSPLLVTIVTQKPHAFLPRNPCILTVSLSDSTFGLLFKLIQSNLHVAVLCNMLIPRKFRIYVSVDEQSLRKSWIFQRIRILRNIFWGKIKIWISSFVVPSWKNIEPALDAENFKVTAEP